MVKFLQKSLLKIAMAALAIAPAGLCFTPQAAYAVEAQVGEAFAYTVSPKANSKGIVHSISPVVIDFYNATTVEVNTKAPTKPYAYIEFVSEDDSWMENLSGEQIHGTAISYYIVDYECVPGKYKLTIPAGTYLIDGVENPEIIEDFTYTEAPVITPVITPEEGDVESLQEFTIEFQGAEDVAAAFSRDACPVLYNVTEGHNEFSFTSASVDGNKLTIKTYSEILRVGQYELRLPGAAYTVDGDAGSDLTFSYNIIASARTLEYTISPVADEEGNVATISPIVITFPNATKIEANPNADYWTQYAMVEYNSPKAGWGEIPVSDPISSNTITYFLEENDQISGEFKLTVPAGTYLIDGAESPEIVQTFNYVAPIYATIDPEEGSVESLQEFTISFANASSVETSFSRDACPTLYDKTRGNNVFSFTSATIDGSNMTIKTYAEIATVGEYELRLPGAAYSVDGVQGKDLTFAYTIVPSAKTVEYTIAPIADADGNVDVISPIVVTFPNAVAVEDNPEADYWTQYAYVEYNSSRAGWGEIPAEIQIQSNVILLHLEESDQIPGEFRLTIPAGTYLVDGMENPEIIATFNVPYPYVIITPEEGEVSSLKDFTLEFPTASNITYTITDEAYPEIYSLSSGESVAIIKAALVEGNKVSFAANNQITVRGDYELRVPGSCYTVDGEQGQDLVFKYSVAPSAESFEYTINPADGETISEFTSVVVKFENASSVTIDDSNWANYPYLETYDKAWQDWGEVDVLSDVDGNEFILTIPSYVTLESGLYHVVIPAGYIVVDGNVYNEEIFSSFTLEQAAPEFTVSIDPEEGVVSSLGEFNLTFSGVQSVQLNNYSNDTRIYIEDAEGNKTYSSDSFVNYDAEGAPIYLSFNTISAEGNYTLVLPANSYKVDGVYGGELRFEYTISATDGIASIFANGVESVDVYDLRGVRVLSNAKAEDIRNLNTAVYIINGQKYLIRK